jgi:GNAT superfamily N-acetyltransferase
VPNPLDLRTAEPADAPAIATLVNDAFRSERFFSDGDRTNPGEISRLLQKGKFFMLFEGSMLAGCVYAELREDRGYLGLLAVDPQRQGSGIGTRLITTAEEYCRTAGCQFMDLTFVNVRKRLPTYYHQFGYVENGTIPFPADQTTKMPVHLIRMSKPL